MLLVHGRSREPTPPAKTTTCIVQPVNFSVIKNTLKTQWNITLQSIERRPFSPPDWRAS